MAMTVIWTGMLVVSLLFGSASGNIAAVGSAVMEGASAAVTLCVSLTGMICLWSGVMEIMKRAGLSDALSRLLRRPLTMLFPKSMSDEECANAISANVSANLLGLGNAATPAGIRACRAMVRQSGVASDELCRLVVMNTASIQLLPTTIAAVRAAAGAENAFDILPAVLISSAVSVTAGLLSCRLFARKVDS